jgi:hypothetical protein
MAQENVVVVRFSEQSKAYQALSVLKECDAAGRIGRLQRCRAKARAAAYRGCGCAMSRPRIGLLRGAVST